MLLAAPRVPVLLAAPRSSSEYAGDFGSTGVQRFTVYSIAALIRPGRPISAFTVSVLLATFVSSLWRLSWPDCSTTAKRLPAGA